MNIIYARHVHLEKRGRPSSTEINTDVYKDLLARYGQQVDNTELERGSFYSHQDIADQLLGGGMSIRPQLIVIAHALPDLLPFTAVGPYIDDRINGNNTASLCLGISQAGIGAPFIALKASAAYWACGRYRTAGIFILEQSTLSSPRPTASEMNLVDSGVMLLAADGPGYALGAVRSAPSAQALESLARELQARDGRTLAILGNQLDSRGFAAQEVVRPPAGHYATGVWVAFANHLANTEQQYSRVLVADADHASGDYHIAVLDLRLPSS